MRKKNSPTLCSCGPHTMLIIITRFTSTNVKLRILLSFDPNLTVTWTLPDVYLTLTPAFPYGLFWKVVTIDHWGNFLDGHDHWADHWGVIPGWPWPLGWPLGRKPSVTIDHWGENLQRLLSYEKINLLGTKFTVENKGGFRVFNDFTTNKWKYSCKRCKTFDKQPKIF